nr:TAXI family TRAP transporter solute-binding subunit [Methylonatrum kenyense]
MRGHGRRLLALAAMVLLVLPAAWYVLTTEPQTRFTALGTGGVTGVYYPTGGAICRLLNQQRERHGIRCSVESTAGSIFNLNALRRGDLEFGIVQSDWQHHAWSGSSVFASQGEDRDLRAVFALHPEPFTVMARADAEVAEFLDSRGKRVNVGNPGSGQRGTVERLMQELDWSMDDFALASELPSREQGSALCDNRIDVILFTVGHPSGSIQEPIATCDARLVPVRGEAVDRLIDASPYYSHATLPAGLYPGQEQDIETFGVRATLVTRAGVPDEVVYALVQAVFENFETFQRLHPALRLLTPEEMATTGLTAPLHPGAKRYFAEHGLLDNGDGQ